MNRTFTNILRDVIILGIGTTAGALVTNKLVEKKYSKLAGEAIEKENALNKKWYLNRLESIRASHTDEIKALQSELELLKTPNASTDAESKDKERKNKRNEAKQIREFKKVTNDYTSYHKKPDLADLAKKYDDPENNFEFRKDEETGVYNLDTSNAPYVITQSEFFQTEELYDKVTIEYWLEDDVFSDANDEVLHELGFDGGSLDVGASTVFIRNDAKRMDYEIVINQGSYYRDVLGYDDNTVEEKPRKKVSKYD